jgi:hypothetical protein
LGGERYPWVLMSTETQFRLVRGWPRTRDAVPTRSRPTSDGRRNPDLPEANVKREIGLGWVKTTSPIWCCPQASQNNVSRPELASTESGQHLSSEVCLGRVKNASPVRGWPRASQNRVSRLRLASGELELPLPGWPRATQNCFSRPRLASDESELQLPSEVSLKQVGTASPVRGWPRASQNCVSVLIRTREISISHKPLRLKPIF